LGSRWLCAVFSKGYVDGFFGFLRGREGGGASVVAVLVLGEPGQSMLSHVWFWCGYVDFGFWDLRRWLWGWIPELAFF